MAAKERRVFRAVSYHHTTRAHGWCGCLVRSVLLGRSNRRFVDSHRQSIIYKRRVFRADCQIQLAGGVQFTERGLEPLEVNKVFFCQQTRNHARARGVLLIEIQLHSITEKTMRRWLRKTLTFSGFHPRKPHLPHLGRSTTSNSFHCCAVPGT